MLETDLSKETARLSPEIKNLWQSVSESVANLNYF